MSSPGGPAPVVTVNGQVLSLAGVPAWATLLDLVRSHGFTGAKEGCAEGECGACAVLVLRPDSPAAPASGSDGRSRWTAVNACLEPAAALDGQEVVTAEGLGAPGSLHPVQHELAVRGGSQCGYCTPGFVCSMAAEYYRRDRDPDAGPDGAGDGRGSDGFELEALSGNLCRCTGYRPIREAARALGRPDGADPLVGRTQRPAPAPSPTRHVSASGTYARASDLADVIALLAEHPDAVLVAGATDWGVEVNLRGARAPYAIGIDRVPELRGLEVGRDVVEIGAGLTLTELGEGLGGRVPLLDQLLPQFGSRLVRNAATIGGNLGTASPIGDLPPALLALDADVVLASASGQRRVPLAAYFTGYRRTVRAPDEVIRAVRIPLPLSALTAFHKVAKRRFDDISSVAVALALDVRGGVVQRARLGLGGVAASPVRALDTEAALEGRPWDDDTVRVAAAVLSGEGTPIDDHRASAAYRRAMLGTALPRLLAESLRPEEVGA